MFSLLYHSFLSLLCHLIVGKKLRGLGAVILNINLEQILSSVYQRVPNFIDYRQINVCSKCTSRIYRIYAVVCIVAKLLRTNLDVMSSLKFFSVEVQIFQYLKKKKLIEQKGTHKDQHKQMQCLASGME